MAACHGFFVAYIADLVLVSDFLQYLVRKVPTPIYTYMQACGMHTHIHAYTHASMHTHIHAYMHACIHTYMHAHTHSCVHMHTHAYIRTCIHVYVHYTYTRTDTLTHTHTFI